MSKRHTTFTVPFLAVLFLVSSAYGAPVIVRASKPYDAVKAKIAALGGTVTYEFKNANGVVADIPAEKVDLLTGTPGVSYYVRDLEVKSPRPMDVVSLGSESIEVGDVALPGNYFPYGSDLTNSGSLLAGGFAGGGVVVGIIDSGTSRAASALCANSANCVATSRVIGGESFVPGATEPGPFATNNNPHGTWVACMIGANRTFGFSRAGTLATAVRNYCTPASSSPCSFAASATVDGIPMVGQAPAAQFYALKVFPASGAGAPTSRILQAMDRAIELKQTTQPNMKVVNMSLGGPTLFAGGDIEDELATSMASAGITLVVSAGNAGPSGITVGSPGTARSILTAAAASSAVHERILRDVQFGTGIGALYRPDNNQQIATFSSRGPNADGRTGPNVLANGFASYAQGANGGISLVSGTSFSGPTVSGVAALLYAVKPTATPQQVRSAILLSARPNVVPTAKAVDQGFGYVNAAGAAALLNTNLSAVLDDSKPKKDVAKNVEKEAGLTTISKDFSTRVTGLRPAERREFLFVVRPDAQRVRVNITNITPALPPSQQNAFFGDDVLFTVHSAKTSAIGEGDYLAFDFLAGNSSYSFEQPESGLMRITMNGDWTNAGTVSADISVVQETAKLPKRDFKDKIVEGETKEYTVQIPAGTASATFRLSWDNDWRSYPTNDLDLILVSPAGTGNFAGATLNSPEFATVANPAPGTWTIFVDGFTVFDKEDKFEVRVDY